MAAETRSRPLVAFFALFALALVLPLATVAVIATQWYVGSERERLRSVVTLIGEEIRESVDHNLSTMEVVARTLATSPSIDASDFDAFRAQALASVDTANMTVTLTELDGRQFVNTRARSDETLPTVPRPALTARLLQTRQPVVSGLLISGLTGRRIIGVSAPVIRNGMVVKIVSVVVHAEHFESLIRRRQVGEPYWAAVLDRDGNLVAQVGDGGPSAGRPAPAVPATTVETLSEAGGFLHVSEDSRRSDWRFVAGIGRDALETPLRHSLVLLVGLALLLVGPGSLLALLMARRTARAAAALSAKAQAIGRGETVAPGDSAIREVQIIDGALTEAGRTLAEQRAALQAAQAGLEAKVEASQTRYRMLAENVSDIIVLRRGGDYEPSYVSPSLEQMLGYEDARAALAAATFVHPDDLAGIRTSDAALAAGQPRHTCLFRGRHRDGHWIWLESVSTRIEVREPGGPDIISVMRDVTARKQQADELRIACDMAELAKAKAENANRAKSEFLAVMSHEIRTPLATIRGYTELLAGSGSLTAEQERYLALVCEATGTMLTAVDDILDFARVEAGDFRLEEESFSLAAAVESVTAFVRPIAAGKGVTLGLTIEPNLPPLVQGDPRRLRQILLNLLNASLRDRHGGLVTLSLYALRGSERRISFALTGSGGRVLAAERDGLGLTIAQRLVARMGGRLERVSFTGEAASYRFSLFLPAAEPAAVPIGDSGPARAPVPPATEAAGPGSARLLLVEDHPINQEMTRRILERQGYRVDVVDDGAAAIAAVQVRTYDLVLMDVQMPGMDGLSATRRIRALQHPARLVPIVALTADVLPEQVRAILEAGMNAHLAKPIDRELLCAEIAAQLSSLVLAETEADEPGPVALAIDRRAFDRLAAGLGAESARGALRGFLVLLDATAAAPATLRAEASTLAAGARRFGLSDLAAALVALAAAGEGPGAASALRRTQVARDLVGRSLDELLGVEPVEVSALVAHL